MPQGAVPLDAEAKKAIGAALRELKDATAAVDGAIGPFVDSGLTITEDRLSEVSELLSALEEARRRYDEALELAGLNPPHRD